MTVAAPTAMTCSTVVVGLVLGLKPRDGQEPCVGRGVFGSREAAGDPGALVLARVCVIVQQIPGRAPRLLLEPVYTIAANTEATTEGAGKSCCGSRRCREGGRLSRHRLGEGTCKHRHVSVIGQNQVKLLRRWSKWEETWELSLGP